MAITEAAVQAALKDLIDPNTGKTYAASKAIKKVDVNGNDVTVKVVLAYPAKSVFEGTRAAFVQQLATLSELGRADVQVESQIVGHAVQTLRIQRWRNAPQAAILGAQRGFAQGPVAGRQPCSRDS